MSDDFQQMLLQQLPRMRGFAMAMTRDNADADDLLQITAERMLKYKSLFEPGTNFQAWAYRIMRNSHISNCRKHKHRPVSINQYVEAAVPPQSMMTHPRQEEQQYTREVISAMDRLAAPLREVLVLFCGAELSYEELAAMLKCSVGTVKSRLFRARAQMHTVLMPIVPPEVYVEAPQPSPNGPPLNADAA